MKTSKQTGFTLVEIAIVLVVIGLLLGGILRGQQLIASARVRNMADQNSGIQAAYFGFIDRFRQIPGDMPPRVACDAISKDVDITGCAGTPTVGGNQNGRVDQWEEAGAMWAHLSTAQFITGSFSGKTADKAVYETGVLTQTVPGNAFSQPILLGFTDDYEAGAATPTVRLSYFFGEGAQPSLLRELDVKLDDGTPATGVLRANIAAAKTTEPGGADNFGELTTSDAAAGPTCVTNAGAANAIWNVDSDNTTCSALFLY